MEVGVGEYDPVTADRPPGGGMPPPTSTRRSEATMAGKGKRGPEGNSSAPQLAELFKHMRDGHGRHMACRLVGVSYTTLLSRFKEDPSIREQVVTIERRGPSTV